MLLAAHPTLWPGPVAPEQVKRIIGATISGGVSSRRFGEHGYWRPCPRSRKRKLHQPKRGAALVSVSLSSLRRVYPNYFLDMRLLYGHCEAALQVMVTLASRARTLC